LSEISRQVAAEFRKLWCNLLRVSVASYCLIESAQTSGKIARACGSSKFAPEPPSELSAGRFGGK
jgi:hypothetical protein